MEKERGPQIPEVTEAEVEQINSLEDNLDLFNQVGSYVRSLPKAKFHSYEEDKELAQRARAGDTEAREELFNSVARMAVFQAVRKVRDDDDLRMELIGEANLALWARGIDGYNEDLGFKFITYATQVIIHTQDRILSKIRRPYSVPDGVQAKVKLVSALSSEFLAKNGREPTPKEMMDLTKLNRHQLSLVYEIIERKFISLDQPLSKDSDKMPEDVYAYEPGDFPYDDEAAAEMRKRINEEVLRLEQIDLKNDAQGHPSKSAELLRLRLGIKPDGTWEDGLSHKEVADYYHVTRERISQLQVQALGKVRSDELRQILRNLLYKKRFFYTWED